MFVKIIMDYIYIYIYNITLPVDKSYKEADCTM